MRHRKLCGLARAHYERAVTLETADIDCDQFANWWEVLTQDGALLFRRILTHPHTEEMSGNPFTRSGGPVEISGDQEVIVRGHMNNTGYVGKAQQGTVEGGFVEVLDNLVSVLTGRAIAADELDVPVAEEQLQTARSRPATTPELMALRDQEVERSRALLRVARRASR